METETDLAVPNNWATQYREQATLFRSCWEMATALGRRPLQKPRLDKALKCDFDGGKPDLAAFSFSTTAAGTVTVLLGKGDGSFQVHGNYGGVASFASAVGDFNGDSHTDVAMLSRDDFLVNLLLGDGSGGLSSIVDSPIGDRNTLMTPDLFTGSSLGDGKLDLVSTYLGLGE
jgi:hypothetical protein